MAAQSNSEGANTPLSHVANLLSLRTIKWRWIFLIWLVEWVVFSLALLLGGVAGAPIIVLLAIFGGWQLGCASERKEWHTAVTDMVKPGSDPTTDSSNPQEDGQLTKEENK